MPPVFTSFDEAWRWFIVGGDLVPIEEQRERFTAGRAQFLAFQAPARRDAVAEALAITDALADVEGLQPFPDDLLHVSLLGVGFQVIEKRRPDDVLRHEAAAIAEKAAPVFQRTPPIDAHFGPINVFPDALILEVHDGGALRELRARIAAVVGLSGAFGFDETHYLPHVTIATFTDARTAGDELCRRLAGLRERPPVRATISRIEFVRWWLTGVDAAQPPEAETLRTYALRGALR